MNSKHRNYSEKEALPWPVNTPGCKANDENLKAEEILKRDFLSKTKHDKTAEGDSLTWRKQHQTKPVNVEVYSRQELQADITI